MVGRTRRVCAPRRRTMGLEAGCLNTGERLSIRSKVSRVLTGGMGNGKVAHWWIHELCGCVYGPLVYVKTVNVLF